MADLFIILKSLLNFDVCLENEERSSIIVFLAFILYCAWKFQNNKVFEDNLSLMKAVSLLNHFIVDFSEEISYNPTSTKELNFGSWLALL